LFTSNDASVDLSNGNYSRLQILANNVEPDVTQSIPAFTVIGLPVGVTLYDDALIQISINFALTQVGANNRKTIRYEQLEAIIPTVKAELYN
jgi:hypothetical protein